MMRKRPMKLRHFCRFSILLNALLLAAVAGVAAHEGYWRKVAGIVTGPPVRLEKTRSYARSIDLQRKHLAQALARPDMRIAFTGDSTIEQWLPGSVVSSSINLGISGDTLAGLSARADIEAIEHIPVWYVGIGINDALRDADVRKIPEEVAKLAAIYGRADTLYWRAVLPVERDNWGEPNEVFRTALNARIRETCLQMDNCVFLDTPDGYSRNIEAWTRDGLHPNTDGYLVLSRQICQFITCLPRGG